MAQKIRIKLKSYDHNLVDKSAEKKRVDKTKRRDGDQVSNAQKRDKKGNVLIFL